MVSTWITKPDVHVEDVVNLVNTSYELIVANDNSHAVKRVAAAA